GRTGQIVLCPDRLKGYEILTRSLTQGGPGLVIAGAWWAKGQLPREQGRVRALTDPVQKGHESDLTRQGAFEHKARRQSGARPQDRGGNTARCQAGLQRGLNVDATLGHD